MEYIVATLDGEKDGSRTVLIDDEETSETGELIDLPAGTYTVSLSGAGYLPLSRQIVLVDTTRDNPRKVTFEKI